MDIRVPTINAEHVRTFASEVVSGANLVEVSCNPVRGRPEKECFHIVAEHIAAHGGEPVLGWAIWEWPGVFIEAEFHTIWLAPDGNILDLTPRGLQSSYIVFLPDTSRKYDGRQVHNIRKPLVKDNDVNRYLHTFRRRFEILNAGELAYQHGTVSISIKAAREIRALEREGARLEQRLKQRYAQVKG